MIILNIKIYESKYFLDRQSFDINFLFNETLNNIVINI